MLPLEWETTRSSATEVLSLNQRRINNTHLLILPPSLPPSLVHRRGGGLRLAAQEGAGHHRQARPSHEGGFGGTGSGGNPGRGRRGTLYCFSTPPSLPPSLPHLLPPLTYSRLLSFIFRSTQRHNADFPAFVVGPLRPHYSCTR